VDFSGFGLSGSAGNTDASLKSSTGKRVLVNEGGNVHVLYISLPLPLSNGMSSHFIRGEGGGECTEHVVTLTFTEHIEL